MVCMYKLKKLEAAVGRTEQPNHTEGRTEQPNHTE